MSVVVKPRMKVRPVNTTTIEGHSVMLHCVATGDPTPTIQWDRNNKVDGFDLKRFKASISLYLPLLAVAHECRMTFGVLPPREKYKRCIKRLNFERNS